MAIAATAPKVRDGGWRRGAARVVAPLAIAGILAVSALGLTRGSRFADLSGDADEYRRLASQVAVHGVFSDHALGPEPGAPTAFREPVYPLFVAGAVAATRLATPAGSPTAAAAGLAGGTAERIVVALQWALLLGTAGLAGSMVWTRTASRGFGMAAAFAVAASPALLEAAASLGTEAVAVPLALVAAWSLERAARAPSGWRVALAAASWGLLALTRLGTLPLVLLAVALLAWGSPRGRRGRHAALFVGLALLPTAVWVGRNQLQLGVATLDEGRAAFNLRARAELDRLLEGREIPAALLAWAPPPSWRTLAVRRYPGAAVLSGSPRDERHYHRRAQRVWDRAVERAGSRAAAAGAVRAAAVRELAAEPWRHLRTSAVVSWRGLFVEAGLPGWRSAAAALWIGPLLLLAAGTGALRALRRGDRAGLALYLLPLAGFALHAAWTEFRPRFQLPALPLLWVTAIVLVAELRTRGDRRRRDEVPPAAAPESAPERLD